uniref:SGNH hydrolase-type esterase domain-containing protein n=1 Tax=Sander lucioperca TaxID=283035 RepID=A0A8C9WT67_SANLU
FKTKDTFLREVSISLTDAVVRRSGGLHCLDQPNDNVPQKQSPQPNGKHSSSSFPCPSETDTDCFAPVTGYPHPPTPRPLFPLTTVIIGDSITRDLRFHNAVTHCFPGAKVADILAKVMDLIPSFPTSIKRIVVHCGHNDMSTRIQECERTRRDFTTLIEALKSTGKSVFISGPLPSLGRGSGLFSRLLSLNTWLQLTCSIHRIGFISGRIPWTTPLGFIDNFNLFWERGSLFSRDGIHPNTRGSQMLRGNLHHALHTQTSD